MFNEIFKIVGKFVPDKNAANDLTMKLETELTKQMKMKSDIILAEEKNGSGKWRVRLMYLCMVLVSMHFIMYELIPYIRTAFDLDFYTLQEPSNEQLWSFLKLGVGGYLGSRGIEKSVAHFRRK